METLALCQTRVTALIRQTRRIDSLLKVTYAIARIVKNIDPEWKPLLTLCCSRLDELIPSTQSIRYLVRTINLIARITPLIAENAVSTLSADSEAAAQAPLRTEAGTEPPAETGQEQDIGTHADPDTEPLTPQNPLYAREVAETMRDLQYDIRRNEERLLNACFQLKTVDNETERTLLLSEIRQARDVLIFMRQQLLRFQSEGFSSDLPDKS